MNRIWTILPVAGMLVLGVAAPANAASSVLVCQRFNLQTDTYHVATATVHYSHDYTTGNNTIKDWIWDANFVADRVAISSLNGTTWVVRVAAGNASSSPNDVPEDFVNNYNTFMSNNTELRASVWDSTGSDNDAGSYC